MIDKQNSDARVFIFDTTLRDGEQSPGASMNMYEKMRLAQQLETLGVDCMEAGFPASSQGDFEAVQAIAGLLEHAEVAALARCVESDIDRAWEAICHAKKPRIHTFLATSPIHMTYKLRKEPQQVLDMIDKGVRHAVALTSTFKGTHKPLVEFSAEDASRSDLDFLVQAVDVAIAAGARVINLPDTVGYATPAFLAHLIRYVKERAKPAPNGESVIFSMHCHDDLGLAVANTLAGLEAGARQAEVTLSGIGERAGNAALEEVVMALLTRADVYGLQTAIKPDQLFPSCRMLSMIIGRPIPANKAIIGGNAFAHESGIHQDGMLKNRETYEIMTPASIGRLESEMVIGKHSGRNAVRTKLASLGYASLSEEEFENVFDAVKNLADKKKTVHDEDLEALVLGTVYRLPEVYKLLAVSVQSSTQNLPATAAVALEINENGVTTQKQHAGFGVGPVDAVFNVIAHLSGRNPQLERYAVNAITGGTDAQGEVTVSLCDGPHKSVGRGSDPDIIVASAKAYVDALGRLVLKEKDQSTL